MEYWWLNKKQGKIFLVRTKGGVESEHHDVYSITSGPQQDTVQIYFELANSRDLYGKKHFAVKNFDSDRTAFSNIFKGCQTSADFLRIWNEVTLQQKETETANKTVRKSRGVNPSKPSNKPDTVPDREKCHQVDMMKQVIAPQDQNETEMSGNVDPSKPSSKPAAVLEKETCCPVDMMKHLIAKSIILQVKHLKSPAAERCMRTADKHHITKLESEFVKKTLPLPKIIVNIPEMCEVDITKVNSGHYTLEVIGGNHTRIALQNILQSPYYTEDTYFQEIECVLYANLSNEQALHIGIEHNKAHDQARHITFRETVTLFHNVLLWHNTDHSRPASKGEKTAWKNALSLIWNVSKTTLNAKYRFHLFLAAQASNLWQKIDLFMAAWENGEVRGQLKKPLKPSHMYFLQTLGTMEQKEEMLNKLLSQEASWNEARPNGKGSQLDETQKRSHEDDLKKQEKRLCKKEAYLKEWEERLVQWEKELQHIAQQNQKKGPMETGTGEVGIDTSDEPLIEPAQSPVTDEPEEESMSEDDDSDEASETEEDDQSDGEIVTEEEQSLLEDEKTMTEGKQNRKLPQQPKDKSHETSKQVTMLNGEGVNTGDWVAVYYSSLRFPPIGRVIHVDILSKSATVHFLKRNKMSKSDIETVETKYVICKVDVEHKGDEDKIVVPQYSKDKVSQEKLSYLHACEKLMEEQTNREQAD